MNKEPNLCDRAKEVWRELGLLDFIEPLAVRERSGAVILEHLLCGELPGGRVLPIVHGIETVMVAVWFLWWDRRRKTHDEVVGTTSRSALSIRGIVANSLSLKAKAPSRRIKWTRPATGIIKLNVDASFHADLGSGAIGALLRDSNGAFIAASCSFKEYAIDAPSMEAVTVFEGLRLADELGISTVAVECDSQDIVQAILDPSNYRASGAVVTDDCRQIMSLFGRATIEHCARESNGAAHALTRASYRRKLSDVWREKPPDFIIELITPAVQQLARN